MARVVFLRGANVGGHRVFRPSVVAQQLRHFDVVNVGAAGTFVVRAAVSQAVLRTALKKLLPFKTDVVICPGREVARLVSSAPLAGEPSGPDLVPFVSVLARSRRPSSPLPQQFPATGEWGVRIVGQQGRFVFGVYRRQMAAIRYLGKVDALFGVAMTTRNWNTIAAIGRLLD